VMRVVVSEVEAFDGDVHLSAHFKSISFNFEDGAMVMSDSELMDQGEGRGQIGEEAEKAEQEKTAEHLANLYTLLLRLGEKNIDLHSV
jgi:hypothetical protein